MKPVATTDQRRATLRAIDRAEARMLPPGWDAGLEHQFGAALTSTATKAADEPCAPGLCDQHNTACGGHCRYSEATRALGQQRQSMPGETRPSAPTNTTRRDQFNGLAKWLLAAGICAGLALIWAASI